VPWNQTGTYYIGAIADFVNTEIDETNETNNAGRAGRPITVTRLTYPDLVVTAVSGPTSANTGDTITLNATVKNQGTGTSFRGSYTGIYFSTDGTITTSDALLGYCWAGELPPGQEATCTFQYAVPWNQTGTYYIGGIADFVNTEIDETDETNNTRAGNQITVQ